MERIIIVKNNSPILLIAPHGIDDLFTAEIVERTAHLVGCSCVINNGFKRAENYNYDKEEANCNNIKHCHEDVVKEEFLTPILEIANDICEEDGCADVLIIHGMGTQARKQAIQMDGVLGYGNGDPPSFSCELWRKDIMLYVAKKNKLDLFTAAANSGYSGVSRTNLNQLWRKWNQYADEGVQSMQIELVKELRTDEVTAEKTAMILAKVIKDYDKMIDIVEGKVVPSTLGFNDKWEEIARNVEEY